jgi:hypothetical protein
MTPPCVVPTFRPYTVENLEFGGFYASSCESRVKLTRLAQLEGFRAIEALLHLYIRETTVPGICFRPECNGVAEVARDEQAGVYPTCAQTTVQSCLVIAGLI